MILKMWQKVEYFEHHQIHSGNRKRFKRLNLFRPNCTFTFQKECLVYFWPSQNIILQIINFQNVPSVQHFHRKIRQIFLYGSVAMQNFRSNYVCDKIVNKRKFLIITNLYVTGKKREKSHSRPMFWESCQKKLHIRPHNLVCTHYGQSI